MPKHGSPNPGERTRPPLDLPRLQGKVFSPSLKASANSLFAPTGEEHQGSRESREKIQSSPRALAPENDNEGGVIMAPSNALANGSGSGVGAGASAIEAGTVVSNRDGVLVMVPGSTADGASSSPPNTRGAVSSPQGKDFVEEVRPPALRLVACGRSCEAWSDERGGRSLFVHNVQLLLRKRDCCPFDGEATAEGKHVDGNRHGRKAPEWFSRANVCSCTPICPRAMREAIFSLLLDRM